MAQSNEEKVTELLTLISLKEKNGKKDTLLSTLKEFQPDIYTKVNSYIVSLLKELPSEKLDDLHDDTIYDGHFEPYDIFMKLLCDTIKRKLTDAFKTYQKNARFLKAGFDENDNMYFIDLVVSEDVSKDNEMYITGVRHYMLSVLDDKINITFELKTPKDRNDGFFPYIKEELDDFITLNSILYKYNRELFPNYSKPNVIDLNKKITGKYHRQVWKLIEKYTK